MMHLTPPKQLAWTWNLDQTYQARHARLLTSGCSFTASTQQLESAASWPGYVRDRCRFAQATDMSYPGMGNDYIRESIMDQVDSDCLVVVMWSGIDRRALTVRPPRAANTQNLSPQELQHRVNMSFDAVCQLHHDLVQRGIDHVFTQYINLLRPPFVAWRDTTPTWTQYLDRQQISQLCNIIDVPERADQYLYDYAFFNHYLDQGDGFHPPADCNLAWTDQVLLPSLYQRGLINLVDQKS